MNKVRVLVASLVMSASGFAWWAHQEGFEPVARIPTKDDKLTLGHGSTKYEDGRPIKVGDTITRKRAVELARNLMSQDERKFAASLPPDAKLFQEEYDVYIDFTGQYGMANWRGSSMRREVAAGNYVAACNGLLRYRYAAKYDCSTLVNGKPNKRCYGVWTRQLERHKKCMEAQ